MDKEIIRELWQGLLPLCFRINPDDVYGMHQPDPFYMMVSRVTYFPLVIDKVVKYFIRFTDQSKETTNEIWLDYEGQPLKWHYPVGLSKDLYCSEYDLPWHLTLHFKDFPEAELIRCNNKAAIKATFISAIKEADVLKHKRSVVKSMVQKDQNLLWTGLVDNKFDQFWQINKCLMEKPGNELFKSIPFRLYFPDFTYTQKVIKPCTQDKPVFLNKKEEFNKSQNQYKPSHIGLLYNYEKDTFNKMFNCTHARNNTENPCELDSSHRSTTIIDVIQVCFSDRIDDLLPEDILVRLQQENKSNCEFKDIKEFQKNPINVQDLKLRFITHGIEIPFDAPLQWLSENLSYPDNFLHICAIHKY